MKVYTVKSNARRDAKKRGLDVSVVVACEGGWCIREAVKAKAQNRSPADRKIGKLVGALSAGWVPISDLMSDLGWQAHSVRGAMSTIAKKQGITIERKRDSGVTSYRVAA